MSTVFAVTTRTKTIALDASRHGQVAFDVFNRRSYVTKGEAKIVPDNPACASWIRLATVPLRRFPIAGTERYLVLVDVPQGAAGGAYSFRLDMTRADHPEDGDTQGPSVQFVVLPAATRPARRFPWSLFSR